MTPDKTTGKAVSRKRKKEEDEGRYTTNMNLRVSLDQYRSLQQKADRNGIPLSKYVRKILFEKSFANTDFSDDTDTLQQQKIALRGLRSDYKKIVKSFQEVMDNYNRAVRQRTKDGKPSVDTRLLGGTLREFVDISIENQRMLNSVFRVFGEVGEYGIAKQAIEEVPESDLKKLDDKASRWTASPSSKTASTKTKNTEFYMQKITIVGRLVADPMLYYPKVTSAVPNPKQKMKLTVEVIPSKKRSVRYLVFSESTDNAATLKSGMFVSLEGDYDQAISRDKDGNIRYGEDKTPLIDNYVFVKGVKLYTGEEK